MTEDSRVVAERGPFEMVPHWLLHDLEVNALAIRLYLVLRQHANAQGTCFPSRQRLCDLLGVSLPTLDKAREQLVHAGALTIRKRKDAANQWASSLYVVHWEKQDFYARATKFFDEGHQESSIRTNTHLTKTSTTTPLQQTNLPTAPDGANGVDSHPGMGGKGDLCPRPDLGDSGGPDMGEGTHGGTMGDRPPSGLQIAPGRGVDIPDSPINPTQKGRQGWTVNGTHPASFDDFWRAYPRRAGKKAALQAWLAAIREADADCIVEAARRYSNDPNREPRFTPHPATWLRQGRWDDEPLPSRSTGAAGQRRMDAYQDIYNKINQRKGIEQ